MDKPSTTRVSRVAISNPSVSNYIGAMALSVVTSLTVVHQLSERLVVAIDGELPDDLEPASEQVIAGLEQALGAIRLVLGAIEEADMAVQGLHAHSTSSNGALPADRR